MSNKRQTNKCCIHLVSKISVIVLKGPGSQGQLIISATSADVKASPHLLPTSNPVPTLYVYSHSINAMSVVINACMSPINVCMYGVICCLAPYLSFPCGHIQYNNRALALDVGLF